MGSCFVIMGFGEKTDFQSNPQRVLNLDKTYEYIIKPVVEEAGHTCIRADEIIHSTVIDKPMYDNLLSADLVIADLSTANVNAVYELGVRHALRPQRTIVLAENNFSFPFDLNHLSILKYEHLGKDIGVSEVKRVTKALRDKITTLMSSPEPDSPVFLFIPSLQPASLPKAPGNGGGGAPPAPSGGSPSGPSGGPPPGPSGGTPPAPSAPTDAKSFAELLASFRAAKDAVKSAEDWASPLDFLKRLKTMQPDDPYILQQMALATYKLGKPGTTTSLVDAKNILSALAPQTSSDAETVGLWGAIHKRLWDSTQNREDLDESVKAYARGYYIRKDYYNGINYAFVLDVRSSRSEGDEALVDRLLAQGVRKDVLKICAPLLQVASAAAELDPSGASAGELFWIGATKVEALFGLGRRDEAGSLKAEIVENERQRLKKIGRDSNAVKWMEDTLNKQLSALGELLSPLTGSKHDSKSGRQLANLNGQAESSTAKPRRLLALDGGGIRGVMSLEILRKIEQDLAKATGIGASFRLGDFFDYIGGTSTGAIIAAGLAMGKSVQELIDFYIEAGPLMFEKSSLIGRLRSFYQADPLRKKLNSVFGDRTLGDADLRSLLLVVTRNATTDSPWAVSNNPLARYNDRNRPDSNLKIPLWQLVRASTAAPVYFPPEIVEWDKNDPAKTSFFVDGGVTPYNNPAFLLFRMATLPPYRLNWPTGEDRMMLISVGTGSAAAVSRDLNPRGQLAPVNAAHLPGVLMGGAAIDQDINCRAVGRCVFGEPIDRELGDMIPRQVDPLKGNIIPLEEDCGRQFLYARYNPDVSRDGLDALGLNEINPDHVQALDQIEYIKEMQSVGREYAAKFVDMTPFERFVLKD